MELQSETRSKITPALIAARKNIEGAQKNGEGNWGKYASAEDLIDCCMDDLLANNILLTQGTVSIENKNWVVTQVTHASGEFMRSYTEIVIEKNMNPQKALAGQTYARRGGIEALLAIPRLDDDGNNTKVTPPVPVPEQDGKDRPISEEERQVFIKWAQENQGLNGRQAKQFLQELGIESSHKIMAGEILAVKNYIENEIKRKGMRELEEMEEMEGDNE